MLDGGSRGLHGIADRGVLRVSGNHSPYPAIYATDLVYIYLAIKHHLPFFFH
jgi:hypothetical protein